MEQLFTNEELVAIYQGGDINALEALWLQNTRLIEHTIRRIGCPPDQIEDEIQNAFFSLQKAATRYSPESAFKFTTALMNTIKWDRSRRYAKDKNPKDTISIDQPLPGEEDFTISDLLNDESVNVEADVALHLDEEQMTKRLNEVLLEIINRLPERIKNVMVDRLRGFSQAQISAKDNISASVVSAAETKAYAIMRRSENLRNLQPFLDYYGISYKNTGFRFWKETGFSSVEWAIMRKQQLENRSRNRGEVGW